MSKFLFLSTCLVFAFAVSACAASAQTDTPTQIQMPPASDVTDYFTFLVPQEMDKLAALFPEKLCEELKDKAVENHNAYYENARSLAHKNGFHGSGNTIIGEHIFLKYYTCYPNLKIPNQNVIEIGLDTKEKVEKWQTGEERTFALRHTYYFFDEDENIVRWGRFF